MKRTLCLLAFSALLASCVKPPALVVRDRAAAAAVKKVAILPFFDATFQSAFDPFYTGFGSSFIPAIMFDNKAKTILGHRYDIFGEQQSIEALKKLGVNYVHTEGAWTSVKDPDSVRWGYTVAQGVQAGKDLGVDAVLMCAQGQYFEKEGKPIQAVSVRLVSTQTGKTLYGLNATGQPGLFSKGKV